MSRTEVSFGELPTELASLPANDPKVQAWFRDQASATLSQTRDQYENRIADLSRKPSEAPKPPSAADFFSNPNEAVTRLAPSRDEFTRLTQSMQSSMIGSARLQIKSEFKDFDRFASVIDQGMRALDPLLQADPNNWRSMYYAIKGANADKLVEEAEARVRTASTAEKTTPSNVTPPPAAELTFGDYSKDDAAKLMDKLGVTEEAYKANIGKVRAWAPKQ